MIILLIMVYVLNILIIMIIINRPLFIFLSIIKHFGYVEQLEFFFTTLDKGEKMFYIDSVTSRAFKDKSYKGTMKSIFDYIIKDNSDCEYAIISAYTDVGLMFYLKYGFKLIGNTSTLTYKIQRYPTINELRFLYLLSQIYGTLLYGKPQRFYKRESEDNEEYWKLRYGTYDYDLFEAINIQYEGNQKEFVESNSIIYDDLRPIKKYPKWFYKYSREKYPSNKKLIKVITSKIN